jgi:hypothetical protein
LALQQLSPLLRCAAPEFPSWIDSFRTASEIDAFDGALSRKAEIDKLNSEIATIEEEIDSGRQLKQLFVGTGTTFEETVGEALRELGLDVVVGPHPRADLLTTNGKRIAAVEAKGLEGAAKEEHVRQVILWMAEVYNALGMASDAAADPVAKGYREQLEKLNLRDVDKR